jgi:tRNA (cytidine32/uridine32-2'-O)-methyltransferase
VLPTDFVNLHPTGIIASLTIPPAVLILASMNGLDLENDFIVILHETQDIVNIAGTVRAMLNMGFRRLRLVRPALFDAYRVAGIAHGSEPMLEQIEFFDDLPSALADVGYAVGTTARGRTPAFVWQHPREAAPELIQLAAEGAKPVALIFGREDKGLTSAELDHCDRVLTVPTNPQRSSLNLAQAVLLVCYELWIAGPGGEQMLPRPRKHAPPATPADLELLFADLERGLAAIDFFKKRDPAMIMRTMRAIVRRAHVSTREAKLVRAVFIEVRKVVERLRG